MMWCIKVIDHNPQSQDPPPIVLNKFLEVPKKEFMINYRVQHIEKLVEKLKANGVTVLDSIEAFDYGKFVHIMDAEGNKVELWEP